MVEADTDYHNMQGHILQIQLQRKEPLLYPFFETKRLSMEASLPVPGLWSGSDPGGRILANVSMDYIQQLQHRMQDPESAP